MQLTCSTPALVAALRFAARATDPRSTMPILAHLALRVEGGQLTVTGTDLNRVAIATVDATKAEGGTLVLPAKKLADVVAGLSADAVTIKNDKTHATIKAGRVEYQLVGLNAKDLPQIPIVEAKGAAVSGEAMAAMIDRVDDATCADETRFHLNGANLEIDGARWRMIATDGHRMAVSERDLVPLDARPVIVPRLALAQIRTLAADAGEDPVDVAIDAPWLRVAHGRHALLAKLIDAQFPPWQQVVPKEHRQSVVVSRLVLADAVKRCALMTSETRGIALEIEKGAALTLSADHPDLGSVRESVECSGGKEAIRIGFAPKYILQALAAYTSDEVALELSGDLSPILIRPVGADASFSVVMPMRL